MSNTVNAVAIAKGKRSKQFFYFIVPMKPQTFTARTCLATSIGSNQPHFPRIPNVSGIFYFDRTLPGKRYFMNTEIVNFNLHVNRYLRDRNWKSKIRVRIWVEFVYILLSANTFWKGMNMPLLPEAVDKRVGIVSVNYLWNILTI